MEFREREGTSFGEAERRYAELVRRYEAGEIDEEQFDAERQRLVVRDDKGRWWAKSRQSGQWHYHDSDGDWIEATPPVYRRRVSSEDYSPGQTEQDSPEQYEPRPTARLPGSRNGLLIGLGVLCAMLAVGLIAVLAYSLTGDDATGEAEPAAKETEPETANFFLTGTLTGDFGSIATLAFSPDGSRLAIGTADGSVGLSDPRSEESVGTRSAIHSGPVSSVAFSADNETIASASINEDRIIVWKTLTGDSRTGEVLQILTRHSSGVTSVAFSPDGRLLASGSGDDTVKVWDSRSGEEILTFRGGHSDSVLSVAYSRDGNLLASGGADDIVKLWNPRRGELSGTLTGHTGDVVSVAYSPDGNLLASGGTDDTVKLWDTQSGEDLRTLTDHTDDVHSVAFNPDGRLLASGGSDDTVKLWNPRNGELLQTLTGHTDDVHSVAFSPDGSLLVSGSGDGTINLWERAEDVGSTLSASTFASSEAPSKSTPSTDRTTPTSIPPTLVGTWEGTIFDHDISEEYPATYVFRDARVGSRIGNSSYPTLGCRGYLQLESVSGNTIKFTEHITEGSRCVKLVYLEAELVGSKLDISFRNTLSGELAGEGTVSKRE